MHLPRKSWQQQERCPGKSKGFSLLEEWKGRSCKAQSRRDLRQAVRLSKSTSSLFLADCSQLMAGTRPLSREVLEFCISLCSQTYYEQEINLRMAKLFFLHALIS